LPGVWNGKRETETERSVAESIILGLRGPRAGLNQEEKKGGGGRGT